MAIVMNGMHVVAEVMLALAIALVLVLRNDRLVPQEFTITERNSDRINLRLQLQTNSMFANQYPLWIQKNGTVGLLLKHYHPQRYGTKILNRVFHKIHIHPRFRASLPNYIGHLVHRSLRKEQHCVIWFPRYFTRESTFWKQSLHTKPVA